MVGSSSGGGEHGGSSNMTGDSGDLERPVSGCSPIIIDALLAKWLVLLL
jgi:hypothetical protein